MKTICYIFCLSILVSCGNQSKSKNDSIIGLEFRKFNQIEQLSNYEKVSDTSVYENNLDPTHGILHVRNQKNDLVVFNTISLDVNQNRTFKILDTLSILNLQPSEGITIGYCQTDENMEENLIAIVDKTDSLRVQNIKSVWKASTTSEKIESINDLDNINCFSEWSVQ